MFRHDGLLGTTIDVHVTVAIVDGQAGRAGSGTGTEEAGTDAVADAIDAVVVSEIERLQAVFNARDPDSDLRRAARDGTEPSAELAEVLTLAAWWTRRSDGAFDPRVGRVVDLWARAAADGRVPGDDELRAALDAAAAGPVIDLSAIAKGWIVDRAVALALADRRCAAITVNAGGDLRHGGAGVITVGIEDPLRPYDNAPPVAAIRLEQAALATSGGSRRGWAIGGAWYPHVLDPRTGRPVQRVASASVLAPDAATADVLATVLTVADPAFALALVEETDGAACLVVAPDGSKRRSTRWAAVELDLS